MKTPRSYRTLHTYLLVMAVIAAGIILQGPAAASGKPADGSDDDAPIYADYPVVYWNEDTEAMPTTGKPTSDKCPFPIVFGLDGTEPYCPDFCGDLPFCDQSGSGIAPTADYSLVSYNTYGFDDNQRTGNMTATGVNLLNGQFHVQETDLSVFDSYGDITFTRTYWSNTEYAWMTTLGFQWRSNYDEELRATFNGRRWIKPDGSSATMPEPAYVGHIVYGLADNYASLKKLSETEYVIRLFNGEEHMFTNSRLTYIYHKGRYINLIRDYVERWEGDDEPLYLLVEIQTKIEDADPVSKLRFSYEYKADYARMFLAKVEGGGREVRYDYNAEWELESVTREASEMGYEKDGSLYEGETYEPKTTYQYESYDEPYVDDSHKLVRIGERRFNPLIEGPIEEDAPVVVNRYHQSLNGLALFQYMKVAGQCLGVELADCPEGSEHFGFIYESVEDDYTSLTDHTDRRIPGEPRTDRYEWELNNLKKLTESYGSPEHQRTTSYAYSYLGSLLYQVTNPDGSCVVQAYSDVGGVKRVRHKRYASKEACADPYGGHAQRLEHYTYEPITGKIRTVTRSEAFPEGLPPQDAFDPTDAAYVPYTTTYSYGVHQTEDGAEHPDPIKDYCIEWNLPLPDTDGDLNSETTDNVGYNDVLIQTRQLVEEGGTEYLKTTYYSQKSGRPIWIKGPDGVKSHYKYYDTADPYDDDGEPTDAWDWSIGDTGPPESTTGLGPQSQQYVESTDGLTLPPTKFAYNAKGELIAQENSIGVQKEFHRNEDGSINKTVTSKASAILNTVQYTRDLSGLLIREAVLDRYDIPQAVSWKTYDKYGNLTTITVDPNPAAEMGTPDLEPGTSGYLHLLTKSFYDERRRKIKTLSPEGRAVCNNYDTYDRTTSIVRYDAFDLGGAESYCPEDLGEDDVQVSIEYDLLNRVYKTTDGQGTPTYYWYDEMGNEEFTSDGRPPEAFHFSDNSPDPGPATWYRETTYDPLTDLLTRTRAWGDNGNGESGWLTIGWSEYDHLNRMTKTKTAMVNGFVTGENPEDYSSDEIAISEVYYNLKGQVDWQEGPTGLRTSTTYDTFGRVKFTEGPESNGVRDRADVDYDTFGRPEITTVTAHAPGIAPPVLQQVARTEYDKWGRVERNVGDPDGLRRIVRYSYDDLNRVIETRSRWDETGEDHELDRVSRTEYDRAGRPILSGVRHEHDVETDVDSWADTLLSYDKDGMKMSMTDAEGNTTDWFYKDDDGLKGGLGRLLRVQYPETEEGSGTRQTTDYTSYDKNGNPLTIEYRKYDSSSAPRLIRNHTYDPYNRLTSVAATWSDPFYLDAIQFFGTTEQYFEYDDLGRIVETRDVSSENMFNNDAFDGNEEIITETTWNTASLPTINNLQIPVEGRMLDHELVSSYDLGGFRESLSYPRSYDPDGKEYDRYELSYEWNDRGRLNQISGPDNPTDTLLIRSDVNLAEYKYIGPRVWSRRYSNETELQFYEDLEGVDFPLYDGLGQLQGMKTTTTESSDMLLPDFRYGYDRIGNRTYEQRKHEIFEGEPISTSYRTRAFTTDRMGRLTNQAEGFMRLDPISASEQNPALQVTAYTSNVENWSLDLVGNWTEHEFGVPGSEQTDSYQTNSLNQYTTITEGTETKPFVHDWLGQLRTDDKRGYRYVWDVFGRLTQVFQDDGQGGEIQLGEYRYDANNRRVIKNKTTTELFIYDGWRAVEEREVIPVVGLTNDREVVRARYGFGLGLDEVLWMDRDLDCDGNIESRYFLHADALGSVRAVTTEHSDSLFIVENITYDAYGTPSVFTDYWNSIRGTYSSPEQGSSSVDLPYLYTGQRYDKETGLYYFKNRYYDPQMGRFLRRDPIGYSGGNNLYAYVNSSPVGMTDPLGLSGAWDQARDSHAYNNVSEYGCTGGSGPGTPSPTDSGWGPSYEKEGIEQVYNDMQNTNKAYELRKSINQGLRDSVGTNLKGLKEGVVIALKLDHKGDLEFDKIITKVADMQSGKIFVNGIKGRDLGKVVGNAQDMTDESTTSGPIYLMYNPSEGFIKDSIETIKNLFGGATEIAQDVATVMTLTESAGLTMEWHAHSQGGAIFSDAAKILDNTGSSLSNTSVHFWGSANNRSITNKRLAKVGISLASVPGESYPGYTNSRFDPVSTIVGRNFRNPFKIPLSILGSMFLPTKHSPHRYP